MTFLLAPLLLIFAIDAAFAQTWSNWASCSDANGCFRTREAICENGVSGMTCVQQNEVFEESLLSGCSNDCPSSWENKEETQSCNGVCYDSTTTAEVTCQTVQACKKSQKIRCYQSLRCTGLWLPYTSTECTKPCGEGRRIVRKRCHGAPTFQHSSYNCVGSNGNISAEIVEFKDICNPIPCPAWSSWSVSEECKQNCSGTRKLISTCTYGQNPSTLCDVNGAATNRTRTELCQGENCQATTDPSSVDVTPTSHSTNPTRTEPCQTDCQQCQGENCQTTAEPLTANVTSANLSTNPTQTKPCRTGCQECQGEECQTTANQISDVLIYGIAAGGGGLLLLIIAVVIIICCVRKEGAAHKIRNQNQHHVETTMENEYSLDPYSNSEKPGKASKTENQDLNEYDVISESTVGQNMKSPHSVASQRSGSDKVVPTNIENLYSTPQKMPKADKVVPTNIENLYNTPQKKPETDSDVGVEDFRKSSENITDIYSTPNNRKKSEVLLPISTKIDAISGYTTMTSIKSSRSPSIKFDFEIPSASESECESWTDSWSEEEAIDPASSQRRTIRKSRKSRRAPRQDDVYMTPAPLLLMDSLYATEPEEMTGDAFERARESSFSVPPPPVEAIAPPTPPRFKPSADQSETL